MACAMPPTGPTERAKLPAVQSHRRVCVVGAASAPKANGASPHVQCTVSDAIPGKRAPVLITAAAVQGMKPGSVIVDIAAETGGNCELTEPGTEIVRNGVVILGPVNLPSTLPLHASQMYARNLSAFLGHVVQDGRLRLDFEDPIIRDTCVTHAGEVRKT